MADTLPEDVVFNILARLPAQDIHGSARHVCRSWYRITRSERFVYEHRRSSTSGMLVRHLELTLSFTIIQNGNIETSYFNPRFKDVDASSRGLLLTANCQDRSLLSIVNPATNRLLDLPPFCFPDDHSCLTASMAYAAASNKYKVVIPHSDYFGDDQCEILTVGVDDTWRRLHVEHLSPSSRVAFGEFSQVTEGGFVHWGSSRCALTLNVETEDVREISVPYPHEEEGRTYLAMGRYLSLDGKQ